MRVAGDYAHSWGGQGPARWCCMVFSEYLKDCIVGVAMLRYFFHNPEKLGDALPRKGKRVDHSMNGHDRLIGPALPLNILQTDPIATHQTWRAGRPCFAWSDYQSVCSL